MRVHYHIDELPFFRRAVITIGTFDGVHTGHQQLLQQLMDEAVRIDGETVIITFHPHPRKIVSGHSKEIRLINTLEEKIGLLARAQVDHLVVVPFTEAFSQLTASQYIEDFLVNRFHPHTIIIGYDHQFGKGRLGDYRLLESYCAELGYVLKEIPVHISDTISVSSTRIRQALMEADLATANQLLGYAFFFTGTIITGNRLGRTIGYPTANLEIGDPEKIVPGDGVYAVEAELVSDLSKSTDHSLLTTHKLKGMMNIGLRPTVDGKKRTIEVNLFDFDKDIYGQRLCVHLIKHLRGEQKFNGLDALKEQLARDRTDALAALTASGRNL
jgi:riboflavin kinase/FMN adenylyltransferase